MNCSICKKSFRKNELVTIRQSWIDNGGFGKIPKSAIVHTVCDKKEIRSNKTK